MERVWSRLVQPPEVLFHSRRWRFPARQAVCWREALRLPDSGCICEVGCGPGGLLTRIGETTKPPASIIGVDSDPGHLEFARRRARELGLRKVELRRGDACALPLPDESVDALTSYTLIEHLTDPQAFAEECRRVLGPGGRLSVATTGRDLRIPSRMPEPPARLQRELKELEAPIGNWMQRLHSALGIGEGSGPLDIPGLVESWELKEFRVDSWSRTICLSDHRLSDPEREATVRDCCGAPPGFPPSERELRRALTDAGAAPPEEPYLTEAQRERLRGLYTRREELALHEARRAGAGPYFVTSVLLAASGIIP